MFNYALKFTSALKLGLSYSKKFMLNLQAQYFHEL